ncbi:MAG: hypothetical protein IPM13_17185 [Phycisphaerales bacterium]|nr:hypothetical protein [Phycisphaerales bacterium]
MRPCEAGAGEGAGEVPSGLLGLLGGEHAQGLQRKLERLAIFELEARRGAIGAPERFTGGAGVAAAEALEAELEQGPPPGLLDLGRGASW